MKRRTFLRLAGLGLIGVNAGIIHWNTAPYGVLANLRWMARGQKEKYLGKPAVVGLGKCSSYNQDLLSCLRELWEQNDMPEVRGKRVLIKPNLVDSVENQQITTAPEVIGAVADLLFEKGVGQVTVGDGSAFRREISPVVESSGLGAVMRARNLNFVDLNYDDPQPVPVNDKWLRGSPVFWLPRHVIEADLIVSVPKLKTHHWSGVSLSLKNLIGVVPGARYGWPKNIVHINGISQSILGIYQLLPPVVSVIDGIVGMQGDGPLFGKPVAHGLLAVGRDPVAVDTTCIGVIGMSMESVPHLKLAAWAGVGQSNHIEVRGVSRESMQRHYEPPPSA
jgi:uncharacterized protein (DUF362 family)